MKHFIDRALWKITGGKDPSVVIPIIRERTIKVNIPVVQTVDFSCADLNLEISARMKDCGIDVLTNGVYVQTMTLVEHILPFHLTRVPVMGLTLPKMRCVTWNIRFIPRMVMSRIDLAVDVMHKSMIKLPENLTVSRKAIERYVATAIPTLRLPPVVPVVTINPRLIPRYFIKILRKPLNSFSRSDLVLRRNGIADALKCPRDQVHLMAIFYQVETANAIKLDYDVKTKSLIYFPNFDASFIPEIRDIIVGEDIRTGKVHMVKYRPR